MAEIPQNPDVVTGINSNNKFLLNLDTDLRMRNYFSGNKSPISYKIPEFDSKYPISQDNLLGSIDGIKKGMISGDPEIRSRAYKAYEDSFANSPVQQGVGNQMTIPYEKWQNKYLNDEFGFNPNLDPNQNEQYYYENQWNQKTNVGKVLSTVGKATGRVIAGAALKLGQGLGYVSGIIAGGIGNLGDLITGEDNTDFIRTVADNSIARYFEDAEEHFKDRQTWSVYKPEGWENMGFFQKLGHGAFWSDEVADGIAFLASAVVPGATIGKLGKGVSLLSKGSSWFAKGSRGVQTTLGIESVGDIGAITYNIASESAFEAAQGFKQTKERLLEDRRNGGNNFSDDEINTLSGNTASAIMKSNIGILSFSSVFENKFFFKPIANRLAKSGVLNAGLGKTARTATIDAGLKAKEKEVAKNWFKRNITSRYNDGSYNPLSRVAFYGKRALSTAAVEGFWEENAQLAAQRIATDNTFRDEDSNPTFLSQLASQTGGALTGKDREAEESIGLGALIGILGGTAIAKAFGGNRFWRGERQTQLDNIRKNIVDYNVAMENAFSWGDIFEKGENGEIVNENGSPKINKKAVAEKIEALKQFGYDNIKASNIEDPIFREKLKKDLFAHYIAASVRAGFDQQMLSRMRGLPNLPSATIEGLGLDPKSATQEDINAIIANSEELVGAYKNIQAQEFSAPKDRALPDHELKEQHRKFLAYLSYARRLSSEQARNKFDILHGDMINKERPSAFAPNVKIYDPLVQKYNALSFEEDALSYALNDYTKNNFELGKRTIRERIKEIQEEKAKMKEGLKEYNLTPNESDFIIDDKKYRKFDITKDKFYQDNEQFLADYYNAKKVAEMGIDVLNNNFLFNSLTDKNNAVANYDAYMDYLASVKKKTDEADAQVTEAVGTHTVKENEDGTFVVVSPQGNTVSNPITSKEEADKQATELDEVLQKEAEDEETKDTDVKDETKLTGDEDLDKGEPVDTADIAITKQNVDLNELHANNAEVEIDPTRPISWFTPLKSSNSQTVNIDKHGEVQQLRDVLYNKMLHKFITTFIDLENFPKNYRLVITKDQFPEVYKQPATNEPEVLPTGEVVLVEKRYDGTPLRVKDLPFAAEFKEIADLPIVLSFDTFMFMNDGKTGLRASIWAQKNEASVADAYASYEADWKEGQEAREKAKEGKNIEIEIINMTGGIMPYASPKPVVDRFGEDFTINVLQQTKTIKGTKFGPGAVVVEFGTAAFAVTTPALVKVPEVMVNIERILNKEFENKNDAFIVREQYLNKMFFTTKKNFFAVVPSGAGFKIQYMTVPKDEIKKGMTDAEIRKVAVPSNSKVKDLHLNVSKESLENGYNYYDAQIGEFINYPASDYLKFIKPKLVSSFAKILDEKGNLYMKPVNPYFNFRIVKERSPKDIMGENFTKFKVKIKQIKEKNGDPTTVLPNIEEAKNKNQITDSQYNTLKEFIGETKPPVITETKTKDIKEEPKEEKPKKKKKILEEFKGKEAPKPGDALKKQDSISEVHSVKLKDDKGEEREYTFDVQKGELKYRKPNAPMSIRVEHTSKIFADAVKVFAGSGVKGFTVIELEGKNNKKYIGYGIPSPKISEIFTDIEGNPILTLFDSDGIEEDTVEFIKRNLTEEGNKVLEEFLNRNC